MLFSPRKSQTTLAWSGGFRDFRISRFKSLGQKAQANNILTALDNTWGAGLAFNAFDFGNEHLSVDMTVHALTKYPSGGGDILMGSVVTRNKELHHKLFRAHAIQGISVSGDDVAQVQRSLASMQLRYEHQSQSCLTLLDWLKQQPEFVQVLHPADTDNAGHKTGKKFASKDIVPDWSAWFLTITTSCKIFEISVIA